MQSQNPCDLPGQREWGIIPFMKTLQVQIDDDLFEKLDHHVPSESNGQALFVIRAIRQALWEAEERATAEAYRQRPDIAEDVSFDPEVWD